MRHGLSYFCLISFFPRSLLPDPFLVLGMIACNIRCFAVFPSVTAAVFLVLLTISSLVLDDPILVVSIPSFTTGFHSLRMFWT